MVKPAAKSAIFYPRDSFERIDPDQLKGHADKTVTIHVSEALAGILHAEAMMARKSVSTLLREWVGERFELPEKVNA